LQRDGERDRRNDLRGWHGVHDRELRAHGGLHGGDADSRLSLHYHRANRL
jgi:hypothetical protein